MPARQFVDDYLRGLGMSARNNALAYGYSITVAASFALLSDSDGPSSVGRTFAYVLGASLAFAGVNAAVTSGFRRRPDREPPVVMALATSLSVVSISAGAAAALLAGSVIGGWIAWAIGAIAATWVYLSVAALEVAAARALHLNVSDRDPAER